MQKYLVLFAFSALLLVPLAAQESYSFVPGSIFVINFGSPTMIYEFDPITKLLVNSFSVTPNNNGRGLAFDGADLWYTGFNSNIYKVETTGANDLLQFARPALLGPIGGFDWDFNTNTLVSIGNNDGRVGVIDPNTGNLLADCTGTGGNGENWSIVITSIGTFWTSNGKFSNTLTEYNLPTVLAEGACTPTGNTIVASTTIAFNDFDTAGNWITGTFEGTTIDDFGGDPTMAPIDQFIHGILWNSQDAAVEITTTAITEAVVGGEFLPIDTTALMLAGLQTSAIWVLPVLAGAVGVGSFYIKSRMSKE